ncbi:hypothetical protein GUJ93_ZPchr0006g40967 [Zizania palustris]|uniref:Uncharacterized protein n=1 Tax=Zizania palustris TaxID=103762 RepID=A0A8J5W4Q2_ZIZPA|nr:hypothetical protein GUJ93_ZPchr0006g40967 [Zizania palustris]
MSGSAQDPATMSIDEKLDFLMAAVTWMMGDMTMMNARLDDHDHRLALLEDRASDRVVVFTNGSVKDEDSKVLPCAGPPRSAAWVACRGAPRRPLLAVPARTPTHRERCSPFAASRRRWSPAFRRLGCMPRSAMPAAACRARTYLRAPPPATPECMPTNHERCSPLAASCVFTCAARAVFRTPRWYTAATSPHSAAT